MDGITLALGTLLFVGGSLLLKTPKQKRKLPTFSSEVIEYRFTTKIVDGDKVSGMFPVLVSKIERCTEAVELTQNEIIQNNAFKNKSPIQFTKKTRTRKT